MTRLEGSRVNGFRRIARPGQQPKAGLAYRNVLNSIMPHSVSPEQSRAQENGEDEVLPDAPAADSASNDQGEKEGTGVKLEDLFNGDDDDDDEYPASSAPDNKMEASSVPEMLE